MCFVIMIDGGRSTRYLDYEDLGRLFMIHLMNMRRDGAVHYYLS